MTLEGQVVDGRKNRAGITSMKSPLGIEHIVLDVQCREILADHRHHRIDCLVLDDRQPLFFRHGPKLDAVLIRQCLSDGNEIVAGVKTGRNRADIFAECFAITQEYRLRQHIDLRTRIVDVVLLGHVIAGKGEHVRQRIADDSAAAVPHMHRACRIGRHIFDVDLLARSNARTAKIKTLRNHAGQEPLPVADRYANVDETGTGNIDAIDIGILFKGRNDQLGQRARIGAEWLCQHHGRVGRDIAMAWIAWRFHGDTAKIDSIAMGFDEIDRLESFFDSCVKIGKKVHDHLPARRAFIHRVSASQLRAAYRKSGVWSNSRWCVLRA